MSKNNLAKNTLAAVLAVGVTLIGTQAIAKDQNMKMMKGMEKCYGIAKAGMNDCGTPNNNGCAGSSKKDSDKDAWLFLPKGTCNKIVGGSTTGS